MMTKLLVLAILFSFLLTACGTSRKVMKNCERRQANLWDCEEP